MQKIKPHIILIIAILVNACNISSLDEVVIPEVNDEFYLDIWENLTPEGRILEWKLRTIENAECEDASLDYTYRQYASSIELIINKINNPTDCTPGEQPLEASIDAGPLGISAYPLSFSLRETVANEGTLIVNSDKYILDFTNPVGIIVLRRELFRVPGQVIWGYIHASGDAQEMAAEELFTQLTALCTPVTLNAGYYGYFTAQQDGEVVLNNSGAPLGASHFAYEFVADKAQLEALLASYRSQYPEGLEVKIFNTLGEEL